MRHLLFNLLVTKFYCFTCEDYFFGIFLHVFTCKFLKNIELHSHLQFSFMFSLLIICYLTSYAFLQKKTINVEIQPFIVDMLHK